jgi:putative colanic acid biosynthesis UDP-glucose lipid carrier transferase
MLAAPARELAQYGAASIQRTSRMRLHVLFAQIAAVEFAAAAFTAYVASAVYYHVFFLRWPPADQYISASLLIAAFSLLVSLGFRHFGSVHAKPRHRFVAGGIASVALAFSFFLSALFLFKVAEDYSRGTFVFQFVGVAVAVLVVRAVAHARLQSAIAAGVVEARRAILIGSAEHCSQMAARLSENGIDIVGAFRFPAHDRGKDDAKGARRNGEEFRRMLEQCRRLHPEDIIILATANRLSMVPRLIDGLSEIPVALHLVPMGAGDLLATSKPAELGSVTTLQVLHLPLSAVDLFVKRAFDIVASLIGLIVFLPLLVAVAAAIKLDSAGPVLFRQIRHGYNNKTIGVFKFRTMRIVEDGARFTQAVKDDPRVTRIGRLLRGTNIDELPQLINVLLGEMSMVGPRPHPIALNRLFEEQIAPFSRRHNVKPGITGWAQVNGYRGPTDTLEKMQRRVECDLYYIDNWSFMFDLKIILMTVFSKTAYQNAH